MGWKLHEPGERGPFYVLRGSYRGQRVEVSTRTRDREAARRFRREYLEKLQSDPVLNGQQAPVTFSHAADAYMGFKDPPPWDKLRIDRLKAWFGDKLVGEIVHADLVEAANELRAGLSNDSKNRDVIGPAAAILHYAAAQKWCAYQRFRHFKVAKKSPRKPATNGTMMKLIQATTGKQRLFLAVLYETGLRISDVLRIDRDGLQELRLGRVRAGISKTGEAIMVTVSPELRKAIAKAGLEPNGRLFSWGDRHNVYRWLRPLCKRLRVKYTPHQSRHALASDLESRGIPDKRAAEHGAWLDVRSLHRYQHTKPEALPDRSFAGLIGGKAGRSAKNRRKSAV